MGALQQVMDSVEQSNADPAKKVVVKDFLTQVGPVVEALGPSLFQQVMAAASSGGVPEVLVQQLSAQQVAGLLAQAQQDLSALAAKHGAEVAAWKTATQQLETAALSVLARVVLSAL